MPAKRVSNKKSGMKAIHESVYGYFIRLCISSDRELCHFQTQFYTAFLRNRQLQNCIKDEYIIHYSLDRTVLL